MEWHIFLGSLVVIQIMDAIMCAIAANNRNRPKKTWFLWGLAVPVIPFFVILILPDLKEPVEENRSQGAKELA